MAVDILDQGRLLTVSKPPCLVSLLYLQNGICAAKSQFYMDCFCNMKVLKISILQLLAKPVFSHHFQAAVNHVHSPHLRPSDMPYPGLLKSYSVSSFFSYRAPNLQADGSVRAERSKHLITLTKTADTGWKCSIQKNIFFSQIEKCLKFLPTFGFLGCMHDYRVSAKFLPQHHWPLGFKPLLPQLISFAAHCLWSTTQGNIRHLPGQKH